MGDRFEIVGRVRDALADLYDDPVSARRVADDAGLNAARIEWADRPVDFWHSILREAQRVGQVDRLLSLAVREYPARADLVTLREEYRSLTAVKAEPPPQPPAPTTPPAPATMAPLPRPARPTARALSWLWATMGLVVVVVLIVVVLSSRSRSSGTPDAGLTGASAATSTATATARAPVVRPTNDVSVASVAPPVAAGSGADRPGCFAEYFNGLADSRVTNLEPGTNDYGVTATDLMVAEPIGFMLTFNGEPMGAIRFRFIRINRFFRIESIADSQCQLITDYFNASRGGDKNVLQNWDALLLTLGGREYELRMGTNEPPGTLEKAVIWVDFEEKLPSE